MTNPTHNANILPYDGNNPNNCDFCGIRSASWKFTPLDTMDETHCLCFECRDPRVNAYGRLGIVPDKDTETIEKWCWYRNNYA